MQPVHWFGSFVALLLFTGTSFAQVPELPPSSAESILQQPPNGTLLPIGSSIAHLPGFYSSAGVLIAPPILIDFDKRGNTMALAPIPSPWATIGVRRNSDISWQASFMLVPLFTPRDPFSLTTTGLDIDRISINRSHEPHLDLRWQVGLRIVGVGFKGVPFPVAIGPHAGMRFERPLLRAGLFLNGWADVGLLPSIFKGIPLTDFRGELGFTWQPQHRPGLSASLGAFTEAVGFGLGGIFVTPGIKTGLSWKY